MRLWDRLAAEAGIDYVKANHLEVVDGVLTGKVYGEIVTKDVKVAKLKDWGVRKMISNSRKPLQWVTVPMICL